MKKNKLSRYLIFISIFTLLAVFVAIVQKSYSNLMGPINQVKSSNLVKPINPSLDLETLKDIEKRI